jgi:hypothetical protein
MKRSVLISLRVVFIPLAAVLVFVMYRFLLDHAPGLDRHLFPYGNLAVGVLWETIAAAVIAVLIAFPSHWFYGRFARLGAVAVALPILRYASPWNGVYHDYHWAFLDWALAFYECGILLLLVLCFTHFVSTRRKVLTIGSSDRGAQLR